MNESLYDKAVYRTAPATPGPLLTSKLEGVGPVDNRPSTD